MKVKVGDVIESDFGVGEIVAITKEWVIHEGAGGNEYALSRLDDPIWIPVTKLEEGGGDDEAMEVGESEDVRRP